MKLFFKIGLFGFLFLLVIIWGCKKISVGFLSEGVFYQDSPFKIDRGATIQSSSALTLDGSTLPVSIKLLDVRNAITHAHAPEFYEEHEVYIYKQAIKQTDTTIELVNKKRELKKIPPFQFLPSGQFLFNSGTAFLPTGNIYEYDIEVSNESGARTFKNIGLMQVTETPPYEIRRNSNNWFKDFATNSGNIVNPVITITQQASTGNRAILKIVDEDGKPFNPKAGEIIKRADRPTFESYAKFHPIEYTDSTMICDFEVAPFPLFQIPGYGSYDIFYRIPSEYAAITNPTVAFPADPGGTATYSVNPAIGFLLKKEGTYLVEVKLLRVKHK